MKKSLLIISIIVFVLSFITIAFAEKICPVDHEVFPDSAVYCPKHGVKLISVPDRQKIYVLTKDGKTEDMAFTGFNTDCDGYGKKGIKYSTQGVTITIPWDQVKYILPDKGLGVRKLSGHDYEFTSDELKPGNCSAACIEEMRKKKIIVVGQVVMKDVQVKIDLSDMAVIAFSSEDLDTGKKKEIAKELSYAKEVSDKQDYSAAIACFKAVLTLDPGNAEATAGVKDAETAAVIKKYAGEFVHVKGGCFQMGDTFGNGHNDERPVHEVCVDDFDIGVYEVTQGQWKTVMGNNPSSFSNCGDNCPVENVSWNYVQEFIKKLDEKTGKTYRLPTEAEWEYAARSGGKKEEWAGTSIETDLGEYAWNSENAGGMTHPVGRKKPNGLGIYDMSGNVYEWCSDWYDANYYQNSPKDDPRGPNSGTYHVLRGGSWYDRPWYMQTQAAFRWRENPGAGFNNVGFRLAISGK